MKQFYTNLIKSGSNRRFVFTGLLLLLTILQSNGLFAGAPTANFDVDIDEPVVDQAIMFTDKSTENPNQWNWNFGDGASPLSASTGGAHTVRYSTLGKKTVSLQARNAW